VQWTYRNRAFVGTALVVIALVCLPFLLPGTWTDLLTKILIMALFATAINIEVGYAGMLPLGQSMFLGFSAYAYTLLFVRFAFPLGLAVVAALALSIVINIVIGFLCLRGESMTFGLLHMGFNILLYTVVNKWLAIGGDAGIAGPIRPAFLTHSVAFNLFVLVVVLICYALMRRIMTSPFAQMAQGLRENEERLRFLGIDIKRFQLVIFTISGFFTSIAGILLAMLNGGAFPAYTSVLLSTQGLMMCLIGGMYTFVGPTIGAAITTIIVTEVSNYTYLWQGILGVIIIGCVLAFRGGILGKRKDAARSARGNGKALPPGDSR
jgi:branched-chain amino acid transport system permease protein